MVAGVLCGIAGAYLSIAQSAGFIRDMTAGKGFLALAALIFAKWRPVPALLACLLFAFADALQIRLQGVSLPRRRRRAGAGDPGAALHADRSCCSPASSAGRSRPRRSACPTSRSDERRQTRRLATGRRRAAGRASAAYAPYSRVQGRRRHARRRRPHLRRLQCRERRLSAGPAAPRPRRSRAMVAAGEPAHRARSWWSAAAAELVHALRRLPPAPRANSPRRRRPIHMAGAGGHALTRPRSDALLPHRLRAGQLGGGADPRPPRTPRPPSVAPPASAPLARRSCSAPASARIADAIADPVVLPYARAARLPACRRRGPCRPAGARARSRGVPVACLQGRAHLYEGAAPRRSSGADPRAQARAAARG